MKAQDEDGEATDGGEADGGRKETDRFGGRQFQARSRSVRNHGHRPAGAAAACVSIRCEIVVLPLPQPARPRMDAAHARPVPGTEPQGRPQAGQQRSRPSGREIRSGSGEEIPAPRLGIARRHTLANVMAEFLNAVSSHYSPQMAQRGGAHPHQGNRATLEAQADHRHHRTGRGRHSGRNPRTGFSPHGRQRGRCYKVLFKFARKAPRRYVVANPAADIELAKIKPRQHALSDPKSSWCGTPATASVPMAKSSSCCC